MDLHEELKRCLDEVESRVVMTEFEFPSTLPVLGPLIQAGRQLWLNVAARWYVRHYAEQQAEFNVAVLHTLRLTRELLAQQQQLLNEAMRDGLERDQDLSARIHHVDQQALFTQELLERDIEAIAERVQGI